MGDYLTQMVLVRFPRRSMGNRRECERLRYALTFALSRKEKMRYIAKLKTNNSKIQRLMIHDSEDGVYLFEYDMIEDGPSLGDCWFESLEIAFESCKEDYGVDRNDWEQIPDPCEHCQQDWIEPVRVNKRQPN